MTTGEIIKKYREEKEMTQQGLAMKSGLSIKTISNIETNRSNPSYPTLWILADALGVEPKDLLPEEYQGIKS